MNLFLHVVENSTTTIGECIKYANHDFIAPHVFIVGLIAFGIIGYIVGTFNERL